MAEIETKTEYRGLSEIADRFGKSVDFVRNLIHDKINPLPAVEVGREWWITEEAIQHWLNRKILTRVK